MQLSTNGGSSYITSGYFAGQNSASETAAGVLGNDVNTTSFMESLYSSTTGVYGSSVLYLYNATSGSGYVECWGNGVNFNPSTHVYYTMQLSAYNTASTTVNALKFIPDSGTFSGTITIFGILE